MADSAVVSLDDKYRLDAGRALITGRQALVRLPLVQRELDRSAGLNTAGLISGYRGSPLGGYDAELWKASDLLKANDIIFQPGLNEDLALTALAGSQQLDYLPGATVDGVFAIWYGKGPGVDRSGDAIKHANLQGVSAHGGVLLAFGDDHAGKSSTTAHQSDLTLASWEVPVLYPASVEEILTYGLAGIAMSRFSGLLVGLKLVNETAEGSGVVDISDLPALSAPEIDGPPDGVNVRREYRALQARDARVVRHKLPRAQAFAHANRLDRMTFGAAAPRFLVATAGKAYADTLAALALLGVTQAAAEAIGLGVYKIALVYPLDPAGLAEASAAAEEVCFVEEKRAHAETQAKALLYNAPRRPRVSGKTDPDGAPLLPADQSLDAAVVAVALAERLIAAIPDIDQALPGLAAAADAIFTRMQAAAGGMPLAIRRPAFCPGCPHNTSTRVPEGSFAATGIGCHGMAMFDPGPNPVPMGHMGAEGANWIGLAPFTTTRHIFQNLGDGTYSHSGSLAIRAAVQAGVNITYKILFNDAVAMTGGQPVEGNLTVARVVEQVKAEGVGRLVVLSDRPERFAGADALPAGTELRHRDELDNIQRALRTEPGVTVIVYDQVCAAEKRRRRKAGTYPQAAARVFINPEVCEGCGDCSVQSNCLAVQPLETELGRKRRIDQSACNADFSCLKGFCPSFVTVEGVRPRRAAAGPAGEDAPPPMPEVRPIGEGFDLVIAGVGGTGVVTVSAVLGMAARIDGLGVSLFDMTGLSQKGGQVFSHLRLRADPDAVVPARVGQGEAHMLLACDLVAGVQGEALGAVAPGRTLVLANTDLSATADFQANRDLVLPAPAMIDRLGAAAGRPPHQIAAASLSQRLLGDSIGANLLMLGAAWQSGAVPVSLAAIEQAIRLNGVAVQSNLKAFEAGRRAAVQADADEPERLGLDGFISRRTEDLGRYRNPAYADRYRSLMQQVQAAAAAVAGGEAFAWAAARGAYKLMAYKDEYEVARLYTDGRFKAALEREFEGAGRLKLHLSPPILARTDPRTGRPRKMAFGPWIFPALKGLAAMKGLRETPLDPFGGTAERRRERELRDLYLARLARLAGALTAENLEAAVAEARAPLDVRGFGPVKAGAEEALLATLKAETVDIQ